MTWRKIGFFAVPRGRYPWMYSHAQLPTPLLMDDRLVRVFFASRTKEQRPHIAYADLSFDADDDRFFVERIASEPVLAPGPTGHFDEHGVYPSCVIRSDRTFYLYYIGWNLGVEAPLFYVSIGLAIGKDGKNFTPVSPSPILSRSEFDPCFVTSPHVYVEDGRWRMTYVSGVKWTRTVEGCLQSHYHIKLAEGVHPQEWKREGRVAVDFAPGETNITRPTVIRDPEKGYRMWFSYIQSQIGKYRIGYAESEDGTVWRRKDEAAGIGIDNEHCREMIGYPAVFCLGSRLYMLFNGDRRGEEGFGVARLS